MTRLDLSYETLLEESWRDILKAEARVKDYLVLFAARRTRDVLLSGRA